MMEITYKDLNEEDKDDILYFLETFEILANRTKKFKVKRYATGSIETCTSHQNYSDEGDVVGYYGFTDVREETMTFEIAVSDLCNIATLYKTVTEYAHLYEGINRSLVYEVVKNFDAITDALVRREHPELENAYQEYLTLRRVTAGK
jgi:hypothetical protein